MNWVATQIEWFKSFWSAPNGKASSRRLMEFLVVLAFLISYLKISLYNKDISDIPTTWAFLIVAILGLKTWDKVSDKKVNGNNAGNGTTNTDLNK